MAKPHAVCEVELLTRGPVPRRDREQVVEKVRALCEVGHEPVLAAVVMPSLTLERSTLISFKEVRRGQRPIQLPSRAQTASGPLLARHCLPSRLKTIQP